MDYKRLSRGFSRPTARARPTPKRPSFSTRRTIIETYSRFGSFRTLAELLTPEEYAAVKTALTAAAQGQAVVADMVEMLKLPGDEQGNGGGIDFGSAARRRRCSGSWCKAASMRPSPPKLSGLRTTAGQHRRSIGTWPRHRRRRGVCPSTHFHRSLTDGHAEDLRNARLDRYFSRQRRHDHADAAERRARARAAFPTSGIAAPGRSRPATSGG